jgi:hypothetical protein
MEKMNIKLQKHALEVERRKRREAQEEQQRREKVALREQVGVRMCECVSVREGEWVSG